MAIYAVVASGTVTNLVIWDGQSDWQPPSGSIAVLATDEAAVGGTYAEATGVFTPPPYNP